MQKIPFQSERPLLRIGSITFLTGLAIFIISSAFHAGREDPTNHLRVLHDGPLWIENIEENKVRLSIIDMLAYRTGEIL
jgi:hypothetical protein